MENPARYQRMFPTFQHHQQLLLTQFILQTHGIVKSLKTSFSRHRESIQDTSKVTIIFPQDRELIVETIVRSER